MGLRNVFSQLAAVGSISFLASAIVVPPVFHQALGNLTPIPADDNTRTDGIVVFTGAHGRVPHGYNLYAKGLAGRLMISGVDPVSGGNGNAATIQRMKNDENVHLDYDAENTIQNARNTAAWVQREGIKSLRLVTSDFHMSRAYFELRQLLPPTVTVYADPVRGAPRATGLNSEETRLACRVYETSFSVNFCYGVRQVMRSLGLN